MHSSWAHAAKPIDDLFELPSLVPEPSPPVLRIGTDATWLVAPGACTRARMQRRSVRRILLALCARLRSAPGTPLTLEELTAIGWPGERMSAASAANRVYVSIALLRGLGLRDVLLSDRGGYWLASDLRIEKCARP